METTKTQDFIKNYYHININYFHKVILEINNEIDIFNYKKITKQCICNLKDINNKIDRKNIYLVDEYIFGIFANIYIINDIYKFLLNKYSDKYLAEYKEKKDTLNCNKDKYNLNLNDVNLFRGDILSSLKLFLITIYPNYLEEIEKHDTRIAQLWKYYITDIIVKEFNKLIYISISERNINNLDIENLHYEKNPKELIDFSNITNEDIIKSPFDYFDDFINYNVVMNNKIDKKKMKASCLSVFKSKFQNIGTPVVCENSIIYYIKYLLLYSLNTDNHIESLDNKIITINQYGKICWFIAILNGICYSDLNRQLILNKKSDIPKNDYSKFILEIIDKLSFPQTTIKTIKQCTKDIHDLLYSFKNKPTELLKSSIIEYMDTYKDNIDKMISDSNLCKYDYFIEMVKQNYEYINDRIYTNKYSNIKQFILNKDLYDHYKEIINHEYLGIIRGVNVSQNLYILKYIYNKLGLKVVSLEVKKDKTTNDITDMYKVTDNLFGDTEIDETEAPAPEDILILTNYYKDDTKNKKRYPNLIRKVSGKDNLIYYNGVEYILDYILLATNYYSSSGHSISGIKYQDKKYLYDGGKNIYNHKFKDFAINCSLIEYDWQESIFKNNSSCVFNKYLCDIIEDDPGDLYMLRTIPYIDRLCFDNSKNIYVYIKKSLL
jgi:hypothetical protein